MACYDHILYTAIWASYYNSSQSWQTLSKIQARACQSYGFLDTCLDGMKLCLRCSLLLWPSLANRRLTDCQSHGSGCFFGACPWPLRYGMVGTVAGDGAHQANCMLMTRVCLQSHSLEHQAFPGDAPSFEHSHRSKRCVCVDNHI